MDPVSGLKAELFRPLTTILVPGILAASPYIAMTFKCFPEINPNLTATAPATGTSALIFGVSILLVGVLFGMLMENLGSRLEVYLWGGIPEEQRKDLDREWGEYLELELDDEILGQRYLQTIHMRLKFELSMAPAIGSLAIGLFWFNHQYGVWTYTDMRKILLFALILIFYMIREASCGIRLLAQIRRHVIAGSARRKAEPEVSNAGWTRM